MNVIRFIGLIALAALSSAQERTIGTGTSIVVRTGETIDAKKADGRVFTGVVNQDVLDANGNVAVAKGAEAELMVKKAADKELTLDLESITMNGKRYAVTADASISATQRDGIGQNRRTVEYLGGGAAVGAIIGAIAGGGKGAAIGAAAGAGAGAGAQVLTRGKAVKVPAESLLTFRLEQPLQIGIADKGFLRKGRHYHSKP